METATNKINEEQEELKADQQTSVVNGNSHSYDDANSSKTTIESVNKEGNVTIMEENKDINEPVKVDRGIPSEFENKSLETLNFKFNIKQLEEDNEFFTFSGYASTFNNIDRGQDRILPGAFKFSLNEMMPKLLWQHDMKMPIGVFTEVFEDNVGLFVKAKMPKSDDFVRGRVIPQMKTGSITDMSIGFNIVDSDFVKEDGNSVRNIKEVSLWEASLVTIPMNPEANVTEMKNLKETFEKFDHIKDFSEYLKNTCNLSNKESNVFISQLKKVSKINDSQEFLGELTKGLREISATIKS